MNIATLILLGYLLISVLCTLVLMSAFMVGSNHDKVKENAVRAANPGYLVTRPRQAFVSNWTTSNLADEPRPAALSNVQWSSQPTSVRT
jgi:hypothetical protein